MELTWTCNCGFLGFDVVGFIGEQYGAFCCGLCGLVYFSLLGCFDVFGCCLLGVVSFVV